MEKKTKIGTKKPHDMAELGFFFFNFQPEITFTQIHVPVLTYTGTCISSQYSPTWNNIYTNTCTGTNIYRYMYFESV